MKGNQKRRQAMPRAASPCAIAAMKAWCMPAPAPCAMHASLLPHTQAAAHRFTHPECGPAV